MASEFQIYPGIPAGRAGHVVAYEHPEGVNPALKKTIALALSIFASMASFIILPLPIATVFSAIVILTSFTYASAPTPRLESAPAYPRPWYHSFFPGFTHVPSWGRRHVQFLRSCFASHAPVGTRLAVPIALDAPLGGGRPPAYAPFHQVGRAPRPGIVIGIPGGGYRHAAVGGGDSPPMRREEYQSHPSFEGVPGGGSRHAVVGERQRR